jgi:hypothetical protein
MAASVSVEPGTGPSGVIITPVPAPKPGPSAKPQAQPSFEMTL